MGKHSNAMMAISRQECTPTITPAEVKEEEIQVPIPVVTTLPPKGPPVMDFSKMSMEELKAELERREMVAATMQKALAENAAAEKAAVNALLEIEAERLETKAAEIRASINSPIPAAVSGARKTNKETAKGRDGKTPLTTYLKRELTKGGQYAGIVDSATKAVLTGVVSESVKDSFKGSEANVRAYVRNELTQSRLLKWLGEHNWTNQSVGSFMKWSPPAQA